MSDCKSDVEITMRAAVLDVTPEDDENEETGLVCYGNYRKTI